MGQDRGRAETHRRPVRALAAWMAPDALARLDRGDATAPLPEPAHVLRDRGAVDQSELIAPVPEPLAAHVAALEASDGAQRMLAQGWRVALIRDLRRVIAAQPTVSPDRAAGEPADPAPGDLAAIAALTLPLAPPAPDIAGVLDEPTQTWEISSSNPNLRISGTFGGELRPGVSGFGFMFSVMTSYLSVAERGGRHVLRDGYHRAYRLIACGITEVPAFVRSLPDGEPLFARGMLPEAVYLGPGAPTLADYHDDGVSVDAWLTEAPTRAYVRATPAELAVGTIS
jgi:hypothetical protein